MNTSANNAHPKLAIIIVSYFAEKTIRHVLEQIPKDIAARAAEIIVLDDASTDKTYDVAMACKKEWGWDNLTVIHNEKNLGYGGNQKKGYHICMDKNYDVVVMLHGDAQYPPAMIPQVIAPLEKNVADMSFGSRMTGKPLEGGMPIWKFCGNIFLTNYANLTMGTNLSEFHSGFRAYRVDALKKINLDSCSDNFIFDTDIVIELKRNNMRFAECTIPTRYDKDSRQIRPMPVLRYGLQILKRTTIYAFKHR
jgi:glycosyltransferase involved in cell wall biosynthesis